MKEPTNQNTNPTRAAGDVLAEAAREAVLQIEYLHSKLGAATGSGNAVLARMDFALEGWEVTTNG